VCLLRLGGDPLYAGRFDVFALRLDVELLIMGDALLEVVFALGMGDVLGPDVDSLRGDVVVDAAVDKDPD
jgi:hypothetical protein